MDQRVSTSPSPSTKQQTEAQDHPSYKNKKKLKITGIVYSWEFSINLVHESPNWV